MADRMQKYVERARAMPKKRPPALRVRDHREIGPGFTTDAAAVAHYLEEKPSQPALDLSRAGAYGK